MIITQENLKVVRQNHAGQVIVYTSGNFDLLHAHHIAFLVRCKCLGDILVMGVGPDYDIKMNKGEGRPFYDEEARLYSISNLKPVDYCFLNRPLQEGQHRLASEEITLQLLRPDIYTFNDDAYDIPYRCKIAQEYGVQTLIGRRTSNDSLQPEGLSTTETLRVIKGGR